jgi:hypothetical protein
MRALLFVLVLSFVGCSGSVGPFEVSPVKAAPTCDAVKAHLVDIGCMQVPMCATAVNAAVEQYITARLPKDVDFSVYCDIALVTGILPVDCVMEAQTPQAVLDCGK